METYSTLLAICVGILYVTGEFPAQKPVTRSFDFFWSGPDHTAGDLRRHGPHFDVIVMFPIISSILGKPLKAGMCWIFHRVTDHKRFVS